MTRTARLCSFAFAALLFAPIAFAMLGQAAQIVA